MSRVENDFSYQIPKTSFNSFSQLCAPLIDVESAPSHSDSLPGTALTPTKLQLRSAMKRNHSFYSKDSSLSYVSLGVIDFEEIEKREVMDQYDGSSSPSYSSEEDAWIDDFLSIDQQVRLGTLVIFPIESNGNFPPKTTMFHSIKMENFVSSGGRFVSSLSPRAKKLRTLFL